MIQIKRRKGGDSPLFPFTRPYSRKYSPFGGSPKRYGFFAPFQNIEMHSNMVLSEDPSKIFCNSFEGTKHAHFSAMATLDMLQLSPASHAPQRATSTKTALINVRIFDGYNFGSPSTIIIDGDVIGTSAVGASVIDGQGGYLIPGFINAHVHVDSAGTLAKLRSYGITTALDMMAFPPALVHSLRLLGGKSGLADYRSAGLAASNLV